MFAGCAVGVKLLIADSGAVQGLSVRDGSVPARFSRGSGSCFGSVMVSKRWSSTPRCRSSSRRSPPHSSLGLFQSLPPELLDSIFQLLSAEEVSVVSMASKALSKAVIVRLCSLAWRRRMIFHKLHCLAPKAENAALHHFTSLGLLFKRCTMLLPTKDRLKFAYNKFSQVPCVMSERCVELQFCQSFTYYGAFLKTLIAGWDERECQRVFNFLSERTNLQRKIEVAVTSRPGVCYRVELVIRLFCRGVLLDQQRSNQDSLFWLTCILKPWPIVSQARLLFILYGPLQDDGKVGWREVCDAVLLQERLWDLARAFILLHGDEKSGSWSAGIVLALLDEIRVTPQSWHMENVARLLMLCGSRICYGVLVSKAINGRVLEISRLLTFLILVIEKDGCCMKWAVKMILQVSQIFSLASERWTFIQSMESTVSQITMELYQLLAAQQNRELEAEQNLWSFLNASAHFHAEIIHTLLTNKQ